jgi:hypothetical protein
MQTHADQEHSNTTRSEPVGTNAAFQFADRRPAAASQSRLAGQADASPQSVQLQAIQAMAEASPGVQTTQRLGAGQTATAQRQAVEEEEPLQGKFTVAQRAAVEDEEPLQGKFATAQRAAAEEGKLQMKAVGAAETAAQLQTAGAPRKNETGLPDNLKSGVESLSGMSMDKVRVHYNSSKPAQLNAYAYAQGTDIHVAPGQEKHLPHEAWHVVQQAQGRVKPTLQMKGGRPVNDDAGLEGEADAMGAKASSYNASGALATDHSSVITQYCADKVNHVLQRKVIVRVRTGNIPQLGRVISEVCITGRAPTDVPGSSQGDHTVAETLINESVKRELLNMSRKIGLNNLIVLSDLTLPENFRAEVIGFQQYWSQFDTMDGEDQNSVLEEFAQRYIELANKRPGTAYLKSQTVTWGGSGAKEKSAIKFIRELANLIESGGVIKEGHLLEAARSIMDLVDMKYKIGFEDRYCEVVTRALQHGILSVLPGLGQENIFQLLEYFITNLAHRDNIPENKIIEMYDAVKLRLVI